MILLLTNRRDVTTDYVVRALRHRDVAFCRLNTEDLLRSWKIAWQPSGWRATDNHGRILDSREIVSVYYRRPRAAHPVDGTDQVAGAFVVREGGALLRGLMADIRCDWISAPAAIEAAEDKLLQLRIAQSLGLTIPRTLVTNDPHAARTFVASVGTAVVKPLSTGHLSDDPPLIAYTAPLVPNDDLEAVALAPHLLQERVAKVADIRVTVVDHVVFACRIASQAHPLTALDWRIASSNGISLEHRLVTLPSDIENACVELVRTLGLRFGAIDLIERIDGHTFLEINPNGQWAWIEQRTGAPIADEIARVLSRASATVKT